MLILTLLKIEIDSNTFFIQLFNIEYEPIYTSLLEIGWWCGEFQFEIFFWWEIKNLWKRLKERVHEYMDN